MGRSRSLLVCLVFAWVVVLAVGAVAFAEPGGGTADERAGVEGAQERLARIQQDAASSYEAYNNALYGLEELDREIAALEGDLAAAEEDLRGAREDLEGRAAAVYKSGDVAFLDVLVGAEDFGDFAARLELWMRLLARERAEFGELREARDALASKAAALEASRAERAQALAEAEARKNEAAGLEADAQAYLDSLNADLQAAIEAERARQAEAASKAAEEAQEELAGAEEPPAVAFARESKPETTVAAEPVADAEPLPEAEPVVQERAVAQEPAEEEPVVEEPARDLAAEREAARLAEELAAAEEAAAERQAAAEEAAERARLAAEKEATEEAEAAAEEAAEAERQARLAAEGAARRAEEEQAAEEQYEEPAAETVVAGESEEPESGGDQYDGGGRYGEGQYGAGQVAEEQYEDEAPTEDTEEPAAEEQYEEPAAEPVAGGASGSGESVVATARSLMGVPYVYGGADPSGFDCSGFTMYVYGQFGISLPHSAAAQYGYGSPSDGAAGDLVFWDDGGGISHNGIATGSGTVIHAPYPGTVVREEGIWSDGYVGAKRLL